MTNKHMKQCFMITKEVQIKTPMRHHLIPTGKAFSMKIESDTCLKGCGDTGTLCTERGNVNGAIPGGNQLVSS
jgi:hypothetical protein